MMYEGFAAVYDALMADVDYSAWADYYLHLAKLSGIQLRRAADCACGTGSLTLEFAARGLQMTGIDLSMEMLRVAGQKARTRGLMIPFICQDMRKLTLHRQMDAVFCGCDGVNYLVAPGDAQAFFAAAYRALRPGGGLFFDISSYSKLAYRLGDNCLGDDGEAVSYIWQNHFDTQTKNVQMDLTFFVREEDGRYARFTETHLQRAHAPEELKAWLMAAGFDQIAIYGDRTMDAPDAQSQRIHVAAIRPEDS